MNRKPAPDPGNTDPAELTEDNPDLARDREDLAKESIRQPTKEQMRQPPERDR